MYIYCVPCSLDSQKNLVSLFYNTQVHKNKNTLTKINLTHYEAVDGGPKIIIHKSHCEPFFYLGWLAVRKTIFGVKQ